MDPCRRDGPACVSKYPSLAGKCDALGVVGDSGRTKAAAAVARDRGPSSSVVTVLSDDTESTEYTELLRKRLKSRDGTGGAVDEDDDAEAIDVDGVDRVRGSDVCDCPFERPYCMIDGGHITHGIISATLDSYSQLRQRTLQALGCYQLIDARHPMDPGLLDVWR